MVNHRIFIDFQARHSWRSSAHWGCKAPVAVLNVPEVEPLPLDDGDDGVVEGDGLCVWGTTRKVMFRLHRGFVALGSSCSGLLPVTAWNKPVDADCLNFISSPAPSEHQDSFACVLLQESLAQRGRHS